MLVDEPGVGKGGEVEVVEVVEVGVGVGSRYEVGGVLRLN